MDIYDNEFERQGYPQVGEIVLYTVKRGDNLYRIARMFNTQMNWIFAMNNLNNQSMIFPNQQLLIPILYQTNPQPRPPMNPKPPMPRNENEERNQFDMYF